jgi:hypothetical protein
MWQPDAAMGGGTEVQLNVPCLLAIPNLLLDFMCAEG